MRLVLGIDIGSSSSKAVLLDEAKQIRAAAVVNLGTGTRGASEVLAQVLAQAGAEQADIAFTVATGYGRTGYTAADKQITEISCHAKGVQQLAPAVRSIIDIGGQDSKVIRLNAAGSVENFVMNDKCAAGTGRFLEVMSRVLDCPIGGLGDLAARGTEPVSISSMCTVFAESEVISQLSNGARLEDVASGAIRSIAVRVAGMAKRVGVVPAVMMTGGGAFNRALVAQLAHELAFPIQVPENPQIMGALGAALFALEGAQRAAK